MDQKTRRPCTISVQQTTVKIKCVFIYIEVHPMITVLESINDDAVLVNSILNLIISVLVNLEKGIDDYLYFKVLNHVLRFAKQKTKFDDSSVTTEVSKHFDYQRINS